MLREEVKKYEQITGKSAEKVTIGKLGAFLDGYDMAIKASEPKAGHWIRMGERHFLDTRNNVNVEMKEVTGKGYHTYINAQCSECRKVTIHDDSIAYQYCPHCGAKMESEV